MPDFILLIFDDEVCRPTSSGRHGKVSFFQHFLWYGLVKNKEVSMSFDI